MKYRRNVKLKKSWGLISETVYEKGNYQASRRKEEYKVLLKFVSVKSVKAINHLKLTKTLKEATGTI